MYGLSKAFGETMARAYAKRYDLESICLRLPPVWHPDMRPFTTWCVAGAYRPEINCDAIWAYVDVADAVQAFELALVAPVSGFDIYNIGAADVCAEEDSLSLILEYYPNASCVRPAVFVDDPRRALWDIEKARRELGYEPTVRFSEYVVRLPEDIRLAANELTLDELKEYVYR